MLPWAFLDLRPSPRVLVAQVAFAAEATFRYTEVLRPARQPSSNHPCGWHRDCQDGRLLSQGRQVEAFTGSGWPAEAGRLSRASAPKGRPRFRGPSPDRAAFLLRLVPLRGWDRVTHPRVSGRDQSV